MANENTKNNNLSESIAAIEKCLDAMLSEQRKAAHSAIDMDDWSKTEEIIAATKKNIVRIESLKAKFEEFKSEAVKLEFISSDNEQPKSAEQPKPAPQPVEQPKPAPQPAEQPKPAPQPAEQPKPAPQPAEQPKPAPKPVEQPKPAPKPAEQPKPAPKPAEQPKPAPKPVEQPKPAPKPVEQPKPAPAAPKPNPLDMEMTDFDMDEDTPTTKLIVDACEKLITKFPFSMRLIYSNSKFVKFFTTDQIIADNDMSKPRQLSNGLWVETNIPDEKIQTFIKGITRYCEDSVNM